MGQKQRIHSDFTISEQSSLQLSGFLESVRQSDHLEHRHILICDFHSHKHCGHAVHIHLQTHAREKERFVGQGRRAR